ncbi:hypothetical protein HNQ07_003820 [Deinococcus metalli]|uniref:Uncharacterized protein n=1 Tax=Deinococcus metalli TaxID=1141878 RepID=A0A7W8KKP0_9DEIO|nr:hypothetical protein [Deinococcus metalli]MBB5378314.1 hypothetical protein [Deinococcus metalli]GHF59782.1 hypothetical protein GCM10017781_40170 [Deinococcus metalli]
MPTVRTALSVLTLLLLPVPAGAQDDTPMPVKTTTQTCGAYTLKLEENGFGDPDDRVSIVRGGATLATVQDTMVHVDFCRDVTGDGVPEVLLAGFSGGAHCCFTHTLYSLTTPPRKLLTAFSAHTDTLDVRQLDGKGPMELVGADWRFAYAYGLSFAESAPLPVVYSYLPVTGGAPRYVENTRAFPGLVRSYVQSMTSGEAFGGGYLAEYAARVITAPTTAEPYLRSLPDRVRAWLTNYGPDIRHSLGDFGLWDWPTRAGVNPDAPRTGLGGAFSAPGTREFLALVGGTDARPAADTPLEGGQASTGTLKLYRAQGAAIVAGPPLQTVPMRSDAGGYVDAAWWPAFAVRRASGRDDVIVRDARSGSVRYTTHRVGTAALTALTDDPLAVAATLLGDLSNVARQVASSYARPTPPRTAAQRAEVQRRIDAALIRARPWAALTDARLDLPRLGGFSVGAVDMTADTADRAQVTATAEVGYADAKTDSEYIFGPRYTVTIDLARGSGGWAVTTWTLTPLTGELDPS